MSVADKAKFIWGKSVETYKNLKVPFFVEWEDGSVILEWGDYFNQYMCVEIHPHGEIDVYTRTLGQSVKLIEYTAEELRKIFRPPTELSYFDTGTDEERLTNFFNWIQEEI